MWKSESILKFLTIDYTANGSFQPPVAEGEGSEAAAEGDKEVEDNTVYDYVPPEPKEWISQGSELEIEEEAVQETRRRVLKALKQRWF